jgi:hypothetical protein
MGVDAGIFAKNAKKYFWFDRANNLLAWTWVDTFWDKFPEESEKADRISDEMYHPDSWNRHVSATDALFVAELSRKACLSSEEDQDHAVWSESVVKFIRMFPEDLFCFKSDHGGEWPECTDEYDEVRQEEFEELEGNKNEFNI